MKSIAVKTRFAPSPTGQLHLGNVHAALFCALYASHCRGAFVLRIEDTDQPDFKAFCRGLSAAAGKKGRALFLPLRAALTADAHGPEMAKLWRQLGEERVRRRFTAAAAVCKA